MRKMGGILTAQPVQISAGERRDFDAGDVRQHQPDILVVAVGHADTGLLGLLVDRDRDRKWRTVPEQGEEGVKPGRPGTDNRDRLRRSPLCHEHQASSLNFSFFSTFTAVFSSFFRRLNTRRI
jgi:hypothetical protein